MPHPFSRITHTVRQGACLALRRMLRLATLAVNRLDPGVHDYVTSTLYPSEPLLSDEFVIFAGVPFDDDVGESGRIFRKV